MNHWESEKKLKQMMICAKDVGRTWMYMENNGEGLVKEWF